MVIAVLALFLKDWGNPDEDGYWPKENGKRPVGSSNEAVLASVRKTVESCAKEVVLGPLNCPQSVDDNDASDVRWALYGDPIDGAEVVFNGNEGRFRVRGVAVMAASWVSYVPKFRVRVLTYSASVEWAKGEGKVVLIEEHADARKPRLKKRNPNLPDGEALRLVNEGFGRCVSATSSPLPPRCPSLPVTMDDRVVWRLNGDPVLNARAEFDEHSGLTRVVGNYSLTVSYDGTASHAQTETDPYEAYIAVTSGEPTLLRIGRKG